MNYISRAIYTDRRMATRFDGRGLMANVGGVLVDVLDISIGGAKVARRIAPPTKVTVIVLYRRDGNRIDLNGAVSVTGSVVHADAAAIHFRFETATFALSKLIVAHASKQLGVAPYSVR